MVRAQAILEEADGRKHRTGKNRRHRQTARHSPCHDMGKAKQGPAETSVEYNCSHEQKEGQYAIVVVGDEPVGDAGQNVQGTTKLTIYTNPTEPTRSMAKPIGIPTNIRAKRATRPITPVTIGAHDSSLFLMANGYVHYKKTGEEKTPPAHANLKGAGEAHRHCYFLHSKA